MTCLVRSHVDGLMGLGPDGVCIYGMKIERRSGNDMHACIKVPDFLLRALSN